MTNLRLSLALLQTLLDIHPYLATEENTKMLQESRTALEHYDRLMVLQRIVEGCKGCSVEDIRSAWESLCPPMKLSETNGGDNNAHQ